jgi:hypothetical protein
MEMKEWERIVRNRPILRRVQGVSGEELYTDELLFTYMEQFEADIAALPRRVINTSEHGAMIRGTETMSLDVAVEQFCARPIDPGRFAYRHSTCWRDGSKLTPAAEQIGLRVAELRQAATVCDELLSLFKELDGLTGDPARFNQRLVRVDELRAKVYAETRAYQLISSFSQFAELRRFSADRRIGGEELEDVERAKRQLARDTEFITAVRDGARDLESVLEESLKRLTVES